MGIRRGLLQALIDNMADVDFEFFILLRPSVETKKLNCDSHKKVAEIHLTKAKNFYQLLLNSPKKQKLVYEKSIFLSDKPTLMNAQPAISSLVMQAFVSQTKYKLLDVKSILFKSDKPNLINTQPIISGLIAQFF